MGSCARRNHRSLYFFLRHSVRHCTARRRAGQQQGLFEMQLFSAGGKENPLVGRFHPIDSRPLLTLFLRARELWHEEGEVRDTVAEHVRQFQSEALAAPLADVCLNNMAQSHLPMQHRHLLDSRVQWKCWR